MEIHTMDKYVKCVEIGCIVDIFIRVSTFFGADFFDELNISTVSGTPPPFPSTKNLKLTYNPIETCQNLVQIDKVIFLIIKLFSICVLSLGTLGSCKISICWLKKFQKWFRIYIFVE
jgi:hypothetical protein